MEISNKFFLLKKKKQKKGKRERQGYFFGLQAQLAGFQFSNQRRNPNPWQ